MKKYQFIIFIILTFVNTGCSEKFLDLAPISNANIDNYYKTAKHICF